MGALVDRALRFLGAPAPLGIVAADPPAPESGSEVEIRYVATPRRKAKGGAGTRIAAGVIEDLDPNTDLRNERWYGEPGRTGESQKMMRDPHVRQSTEYVLAPLLAGDWRAKPAGDTPLDREVAAFIEYALFERLPWTRVLRSIVRGYVRDGFHLVEPTDDFATLPRDRFPNHPNPGRAILFTGMHERPAASVKKFIQSTDNPAQLAAVQQYLSGSDTEKAGYVTIPADRLLRWTWDQDGANFAGLAILRSAYGPWKLKTMLLTLAAIKAERESVGLPVLTLGEKAIREDIETAQEGLAELRAQEKGFWINPHGYDLKWLEAQVQGSGLEAQIARCNIDIAMNVAAGFMLLSLANATGSNALAGTQQGQHHLGIVGHGEFVASVFNYGSDGWSPIERLVRLNYGPDVALPKLEVRHLPTRNWLEVAAKINEGITSGAITACDETEREYRSIVQINPHDPESARPRGATPPPPSPTQPPRPAVQMEPEDTDPADGHDKEHDAEPQKAEQLALTFSDRRPQPI